MNQLRSFAVILLFLGWAFIGISQENEASKLSLDDGSIDSQIEYVIKESNNYQQYEVIPKNWMVKLRKNVADSVKSFRQKANKLRSNLKARDSEIMQLTSNLQSTQDTLRQTRKAQNDMALLGMPMQKSSYRATMWTIIGVLILFLLIFIVRFNRSQVATRESKESLKTVQDEYDQHRKRSLEREQKLRRELQDELNKQNRK
ncbi:MAG: tRNA (guanine-N1)-methyltransferase [Owenweeksia sp.]|nr:tRNA (guanine-N1)-methyltransferase [Owenweeksia sp.]